MRETAKHVLAALAVSACVGGLVLLVFSWRSNALRTLDTHWEAGALDPFAEVATAAGIDSPSLHRARAREALEHGDAATAVLELFAASALDDTLSGRAQLLTDLSVTQESLGLTKTLFDGTWFRFTFLQSNRVSWWLFATAFWMAAIAAFARWYRPDRFPAINASLGALVALLVVAGLGIRTVGRMAPPYAVLLGPGTVPLFRTAAAVASPNDASGRLAELPAGTLVTLSEGSDGNGTIIQLVEPFGGWIQRHRARPTPIGVRN